MNLSEFKISHTAASCVYNSAYVVYGLIKQIS